LFRRVNVYTIYIEHTISRILIRTVLRILQNAEGPDLRFGVRPGLTDPVPDVGSPGSAARRTADILQDSQDFLPIPGAGRPAFPLGVFLLAEPLHIFRATPDDVLKTRVNAVILQSIGGSIRFQV